MTYKEAIKNIDAVEDILIHNFGGYPYTEEEELLLITLDKAREAVKKQIPKKVVRSNLRPTEYGSPWRCPNCEADLIKVEFISFNGGEKTNKVSYCWHCGSAVDWSDDE